MRADALGLFWQEMPVIKEDKAEEKYLPPANNWSGPDFLPYFAEAQRFDVPIMSDMDILMAQQNRETWFYDLECYPNYFLAAFRSQQTGKVIYWEKVGTGHWNDNPDKLQWVLENILLVGFNNKNYDDPMIQLSMLGLDTYNLKLASNCIIQEGLKPWMFHRKFKHPQLNMNTIDIMEVAPLSGSLKAYAGRAGANKMQDLPYYHETHLSDGQISVVRWYCVNDLTNTQVLYELLKTEMELRVQMSEEYGVDLRSKSDAQIAEAVISHELQKLTGDRPAKPSIPAGTCYAYKVPAYLQYQTPVMQQLLKIVRASRFVVTEEGGVDMPPTLRNLKVEMGNSVYRLGIGGLHSSEKKQCVFATKARSLEDVDVESYYPRIILNLGLFPQHLGKAFLKVFDKIVVTRLDAKHTGNKKVANSLKIVINGTFGKLGSKYSIFYSPDLLIQVTLTGQLSLLMLIEALELSGISVVSANTDGIVVSCPVELHELRDRIITWWEGVTRFKMEATPYEAICSRDVNNYIAIKAPDKEGKRGAKLKGAYANAGLSKNPVTTICNEAVVAYLLDRTPLHETICACTDIQKFVSVRKVKGGAVHVVYRDMGEHTSAENMEQHLLDTGWRPYYGGTMIHKDWIEKRLPYDRMAISKEHLMRGPSFAPLPEGAPPDPRNWAPGLCWLAPEHLDNPTPQGLTKAYATARWQPVRAEYLGAMIRWYYSKLPEGQTQRILYAGSPNKVPKSDGAKPIMEFDGSFPEDINYEWYIEESRRILRDLGYE